MNAAHTAHAPLRDVSSVRIAWTGGCYLAWSVCRTVSLASDFLRVGPRGGRHQRYAVRRGIDSTGIATDGCSLFTNLDDAVECFLRYADAVRLPGTYGGTAIDPDSIDVSIAR